MRVLFPLPRRLWNLFQNEQLVLVWFVVTMFMQVLISHQVKVKFKKFEKHILSCFGLNL